MKKLILLLALIIISCSSSDKELESTEGTSFEFITYITLTNENTGGGSQKVYLTSGLTEDQTMFCFCNDLCSREIIQVFEIQRNEGTNEFRYKINPSDSYIKVSYQDWCTRFN
tara:strand:- start:59 stop:397 length:339 start_codon:yes stop_codon:yes gene_type:complete